MPVTFLWALVSPQRHLKNLDGGLSAVDFERLLQFLHLHFLEQQTFFLTHGQQLFLSLSCWQDAWLPLFLLFFPQEQNVDSNSVCPKADFSSEK